MYSNGFKDFITMLHEGKYVVLDTETTGIKDDDEIVQLAIVDSKANVIFDEKMKPVKEISPGAFKAHRMSYSYLSKFPPFTSQFKTIYKDILKGDTDTPLNIIAYNAEFDHRLFVQTLKRYNIGVKWMEKVSWWCAMIAITEHIAKLNNNPKQKWPSLEAACKFMNVQFSGPAHNAATDAKMTALLMNELKATVKR